MYLTPETTKTQNAGEAAAPPPATRTGPISIALAGNPNSGKTTIFNNLTGSHQHVANYPGVTVEKRQGTCRFAGQRIDVVDLPGTYSLTALSIDEIVARNFIIQEQPDVVVDIIDASNLERNLYLAVQLMELKVPLVLVLNMFDLAQNSSIQIDLHQLSDLLGVPVVPTVGHKNKGTEQLLTAVLEVEQGKYSHQINHIEYGTDIEDHLQPIAQLIAAQASFAPRARWMAIKLLEGDEAVTKHLKDTHSDFDHIIQATDRAQQRLKKLYGDSSATLIADRRYGFISGICQQCVTSSVEQRHELSDRIDTILIHPVLGLPIFLALMYMVFYSTFTLGNPLMAGIQSGFEQLGSLITGFWPAGADSALKSLLVDGLIGGVGGVIVFLPNILLLFMAISILEDTGYMARAAFIMDRFMHKIGLHGKSFIPMVIGFGCTVPALMSTRILEHRRDRLTTMMVLPLFSCGARLPIYTLLIPAFFPRQWQAPVLWIIYLTGIILAVVLAKILRLTLFRGSSTGLVMELVPYRMPTVRGILTHTWQRGWMYLRKAGTIILPISLLLWALTSYPKLTQQQSVAYQEPAKLQTAQLANSYAGRVGKALETVTRPLGFDWRINTALIGALAAKEVFVAQMGIVFSISGNDQRSQALATRLQAAYTPLMAFCIMLFCLISSPCMATLVVISRESGSWLWGVAQFIGLTILAYTITFVVYQAGAMLGF